MGATRIRGALDAIFTMTAAVRRPRHGFPNSRTGGTLTRSLPEAHYVSGDVVRAVIGGRR